MLEKKGRKKRKARRKKRYPFFTIRGVAKGKRKQMATFYVVERGKKGCNRLPISLLNLGRKEKKNTRKKRQGLFTFSSAQERGKKVKG